MDPCWATLGFSHSRPAFTPIEAWGGVHSLFLNILAFNQSMYAVQFRVTTDGNEHNWVHQSFLILCTLTLVVSPHVLINACSTWNLRGTTFLVAGPASPHGVLMVNYSEGISLLAFVTYPWPPESFSWFVPLLCKLAQLSVTWQALVTVPL